jgi:hypothetical protein
LTVKSRRAASSDWLPKTLSRSKRPCASVCALLPALFAVMAAESGHFDGFRAHADVHDLEAAADDPRTAEAAADLLRRGVGGDVEILRRQSGQQVANRTADDVGLVAILLQGPR